MRAYLTNAWDVLLRGGAALYALLGNPGDGLGLLCALMAADYATGLLRAALGKSDKSARGTLSARSGFLGLLRKGAMLLVVLIAALVDRAVGREGLLRSAAVWFYVCNEGISVLENLMAMGVPVPGALRRALLGEGAPADAGAQLPADTRTNAS